MRRAAVGMSVVVHAVVCLVVFRRDRMPRVGLEPVPSAVVTPADESAIEVVVLPATAASAAVRTSAASSDQRAPSGRARDTVALRATTMGVPTTSGDRDDTAPREAAAGTGPAADAATARSRPPSIDLRLDPTVATRIALGGGPLADETTVSGRIEKVPGGAGVVHDRVTTMTIERDGAAHFHDERDITAELVLPVPPSVEEIRTGLGALLTDWYRDPYAGTRFGPTSELSNAALAAPGACDTWGSSLCDDPFAPEQERKVKEFKRARAGLGIGVAGKLDISAWLQRKLVGDPFASRKLKLLDDTRDERVASGAQFRAEQLARSAELMTRTLEELWRSTPDPALRREALFELWDDCAEGDEEAGAAGERARSIVIGWIRARLPAGSPEAYSDEEVRALAARRHSKQPFTPY